MLAVGVLALAERHEASHTKPLHRTLHLVAMVLGELKVTGATWLTVSGCLCSRSVKGFQLRNPFFVD